MSTHNSERRTLLRGAALLALFLAGCQKKEGADSRTQAPEAAVPPPGQTGPASGAGSAPKSESAEGALSGGAPASEAMAQGGKLSQAQAQYQNRPKGDQRCSNCTQFIAESSTCKVVEGKVSPDGWCMLWAKKA